MSRRERRQMRIGEETVAALKPAVGPQHSYGLRAAGDGLYVVVRVTDKGEETLTRPNRRGVAMGALVNRIEDDEWR